MVSLCVVIDIVGIAIRDHFFQSHQLISHFCFPSATDYAIYLIRAVFTHADVSFISPNNFPFIALMLLIFQ